ncbi:MFS transporter, partial [Chloroflexota bacterium]
ACFLINFFINGAVFFGFTAFFEPIANEFSWSYAQVSLAASLRGMEMGLLAPVAGLAVDRYGPRKLVFAGAICLGIGLALLSRVSSLAMFYGAFVLITMGMSACAGVVTMTAVAHWFRRRVSIAMGLAMSGTAMGGLLIPVNTLLIDEFGWRMAILGIGVGICFLLMLLSMLLRHQPEHYGYLPDGAVENTQITRQPVTAELLLDKRAKMGLKQVLTNRPFWHISISYLGNFLAVTAVLTHIMPYLSSVGIARATSSLLSSVVPMATIFGRLGFGWLGDRFDQRWLTTISVIAVGVGMFLFSYISSDGMWLAMPFTLFFSIGWGGSAIMIPVLIRTYYGRSSFGTALGFVMGITAVGQVLGSPVAGWIFDTSGSYQSAWIGFAVLLFASAIVMVTAPKPDTGVKMINER